MKLQYKFCQFSSVDIFLYLFNFAKSIKHENDFRALAAILKIKKGQLANNQ